MPMEPKNPTEEPDKANLATTREARLQQQDAKSYVLVELSNRLVNGAEIIRVQYSQVTQGGPRAILDKALLQWLDLMQDFYHAGGSGCALAQGGKLCSTGWEPVPLCWSCAGGKGLPPKTIAAVYRDGGPDESNRGCPVGESADSSDAPGNKVPGQVETRETAVDVSAVAGSEVAPGEEHTGGALGGGPDILVPGQSPINCSRVYDDGSRCAIKDMHIHMSSLGDCRRSLAKGLFGAPVTTPGQPHWENARDLGSFGESIVVRRIREGGDLLSNVLDEQASLDFSENGIRYVGHPDGNIKHPSPDQQEHNLEIKCLSEARYGMFRDQGVEVYPGYRTQAIAYMYAKGQHVTHFAVMSRDSGRIHEEEFPLSPDAVHNEWQGIAERIEEVADIIMAGELPAPDFNGEQFECVVCNYAEDCPAKQLALAKPNGGRRRTRG